MTNHVADSKYEQVKLPSHRALYHAVSKQRWSVFQKRELQFWQQNEAFRSRKVFAKRYYVPIIQKLIKKYGNYESILEIGSGPVCISQYLNITRQTYLDPLMDDYRRLFPGILPDDATFLTVMAEKMELESGTFDCVLCLNTLSDVHNPELVLNKVERVLKKDGLFIVSINTWPSWIARAHFILSRFILSIPRINCLYSYTFKGFSNSLARHFEMISHQPISRGLSFSQEYLFVCKLRDKNKQNR
ncbi:MAG: methyltransferase domain-containing protein [Ghiorsea sp.]